MLAGVEWQTAVMPETPWWRDAVVYQIYPRSFADSNGDGVGDLAGITSKLDYLADLGVDALWLSPIFTSPMRDFGYDVADYCGIDPVFGTDADFDDLISGLHDRGMRLLLDWVPNHTSSDHPWFVESRSSRDNPKRDWYVWRDRKPDGSPPTNWMSQFKGVPAWTHDEATDQSYLHVFLSEQPDLNWANPDVEAAMLDTLRYWLDRGVDGFRSDVVNLIGKGTDVEDLPEHLVTMPLLATDRPFGHELLRRIRSLLDRYDHDPMMVGEVYLLRDGESASYLGTPDAPELHLSFDFRPLHTSWDAARMQRALEKMETDFDEPRWPTFVLSNHDQPRHRTRYGSESRARAAAVMALTVRGTPFLYAGEELGLEDAVVPPERVVDPDGRDGCRGPIPWTTDGNDEVGRGWPVRPWLPFPANSSTHAASVQVGEPHSMHSLYRELLALRHDREVLRRGSIEFAPADGEVIRFDRVLDDARLTVLVNLGDAAVLWPDDLGTAAVVLSTNPDRTRAGGELAPDEATVLQP
jgi:alpha-glucosidase